MDHICKFQNRITIPKNSVDIKLFDSVNNHKEFDFKLDLNKIDGYEKIPSEAKVYVEAYRKPFWQRFQYGTYRDIKKPKEGTELTQIYSDNPSFRIKIVKTEKDGREKVCASATNIFASNDNNKNSFMAWIERDDIGEQFWKLADEEENVVHLNSKIDNINEIIKKPLVYSLILPQVFRQILYKYIIVEDINILEEEKSDNQYTIFQKFMENLYKKNNEEYEPPDVNEGPERCIEFIEKTVDLFCSLNNFTTKVNNQLNKDHQ